MKIIFKGVVSSNGIMVNVESCDEIIEKYSFEDKMNDLKNKLMGIKTTNENVLEYILDDMKTHDQLPKKFKTPGRWYIEGVYISRGTGSDMIEEYKFTGIKRLRGWNEYLPDELVFG